MASTMAWSFRAFFCLPTWDQQITLLCFFFFVCWVICMYICMLGDQLRGGFKNPRHGYPPPTPSTDGPLRKTEIFSPKTAFFAQKTPFLGQFLMDFFLTERGGTPPPRTVGSRKPNGKKLTEKGGTPPLHGKFPCRGFLKPSLSRAGLAESCCG